MTMATMTAQKVKAGAKAPSKARRHARKKPPRDFVVAWQCDGRRDANRARDLSVGGIFIENMDPPEPGTVMLLLFDAPEGEIRVNARVRYIRLRGGMGVEFTGMDFATRWRLYDMLKRLADRFGRMN